MQSNQNCEVWYTFLFRDDCPSFTCTILYLTIEKIASHHTKLCIYLGDGEIPYGLIMSQKLAVINIHGTSLNPVFYSPATRLIESF